LNSQRLRVFYALWPDRSVNSALARTAQRMHSAVSGLLTRDDSIHLTLAFVGNVDSARLGELLGPPAELTVARFTLTLDRWGCWPRNGVAWVAPSRVPDPLRRLVAGMEAWLRDVGFELDVRPFNPHVTLVRRAQCAPLPDSTPSIEWQVADYVLVRSTLAPAGSRYEIIGRWPLPIAEVS
jgi:RNA 2',3'-cyclic 3'-phosphodiesterase